MKLKKSTKIILVIASAILVLFLSAFGLYEYGLGASKKSKEGVNFVITPGMGTVEIIDHLKEASLIRSTLSAKIYCKLHGLDALNSGRYEFTKDMGAKTILQMMQNGETSLDEVRITFIEGKRITDYASQIAKAYSIEKEDVLNKLADETYLKSLIEKYWFLTDEILNNDIYYPLEGYLFPDTYFFAYDASIEDIIEKMLDNTKNKLDSLQKEMEESTYSAHEIFSIASIIELEAKKDDDRRIVGEIIYNRLHATPAMSLGMDATTYYGVKLEMGEKLLTFDELYDKNPYNTRAENMEGKLPIGPICNPSLSSITAAVRPEVGDYYFVYAKDDVLYFTKTQSEHDKIIFDLNK